MESLDWTVLLAESVLVSWRFLSPYFMAHEYLEDNFMFLEKSSSENEDKRTVLGISDPIKRYFLAGLFVGIGIGIAVGGILCRHPFLP
jgi:hypothetical protein